MTDKNASHYLIVKEALFSLTMFKGSLQATGISAGLRLQTLDNAAVESHLKTILKAIHEIYHQNASHLSFEMLYRYCYQLVLSKQGTKIVTHLIFL